MEDAQVGHWDGSTSLSGKRWSERLELQLDLQSACVRLEDLKRANQEWLA
jgi:hypothetical protein